MHGSAAPIRRMFALPFRWCCWRRAWCRRLRPPVIKPSPLRPGKSIGFFPGRSHGVRYSLTSSPSTLLAVLTGLLLLHCPAATCALVDRVLHRCLSFAAVGAILQHRRRAGGANHCAWRASSKMRRIVLILAVAGCIIGVRLWASSGRGGRGIESALSQIRSTRAGAIVFAPFEPFGRTIAAQTMPDLAGSYRRGGCAAGRAGGVDRHPRRELSGSGDGRQPRGMKNPAHSRRIISVRCWHQQDRQPKAADAALAWRRGSSCVATNSFCHAQLLWLMLLMLVIAISTAPLLISTGGTDRTKLIARAIGIAVYLTFFLSGMIHFDFRGDVDQMDTLKGAADRIGRCDDRTSRGADAGHGAASFSYSHRRGAGGARPPLHFRHCCRSGDSV